MPRSLIPAHNPTELQEDIAAGDRPLYIDGDKRDPGPDWFGDIEAVEEALRGRLAD
jgi:hypothetical protein